MTFDEIQAIRSVVSKDTFLIILRRLVGCATEAGPQQVEIISTAPDQATLRINNPPRHDRVAPLPPEIGIGQRDPPWEDRYSKPQQRAAELRRREVEENQRIGRERARRTNDLKRAARKIARAREEVEEAKLNQEQREREKLRELAAGQVARDVQNTVYDNMRSSPNRHPWDEEIDYTWGSDRYRRMLGSQYKTDHRGAWQHSGQFSYLFEEPPLSEPDDD